MTKKVVRFVQEKNRMTRSSCSPGWHQP